MPSGNKFNMAKMQKQDAALDKKLGKNDPTQAKGKMVQVKNNKAKANPFGKKK
jgi:hypothetical protein